MHKHHRWQRFADLLGEWSPDKARASDTSVKVLQASYSMSDNPRIAAVLFTDDLPEIVCAVNDLGMSAKQLSDDVLTRVFGKAVLETSQRA
jgi:hypothetical protein